MTIFVNVKSLFSCILIFSCSLQLAAGNADLFHLDEEKIAREFADIDQIEQNLEAGEMVLPAQNLNPKPPHGIPSYIYGCCMGVTGIFFIKNRTQSKKETWKAVAGCATLPVAMGLISLVFWL